MLECGVLLSMPLDITLSHVLYCPTSSASLGLAPVKLGIRKLNTVGPSLVSFHSG